MKKRLGIIFLSTLLFSSCLDEIKLAQPALAERLVIEGGITDNANENVLRLSYTDGVGAPKRVLPTSGVYVEIQSSVGDKIVMRADPYGSGLFTPERGKFLGKAGVSYSLYVKLADGREYKSPAQLMPAKVLIKKLAYEVTEKPQVGFAITADLDDPKETENYYRWKAESFKIKRTTGVPVAFSICCTTCWVKDISENLNMLSDQNFNGNTIKNHPVYFSQYSGAGMHKINIKQYGISKEAYQYYKKLKSQLARSGSIFDPLPATVRGNVVNTQNPDDVALGFFEVSTINKKQLDILDDKLKKYDAFYGSNLYVLEGDCLLRYPYSVYFETYNQSLFN
jgi:hypothetical protein